MTFLEELRAKSHCDIYYVDINQQDSHSSTWVEFAQLSEQHDSSISWN